MATSPHQKMRHIKQGWAGSALLTQAWRTSELAKGGNGSTARRRKGNGIGQWHHQLGSAREETFPGACLCPASTCLIHIYKKWTHRTWQHCSNDAALSADKADIMWSAERRGQKFQYKSQPWSCHSALLPHSQVIPSICSSPHTIILAHRPYMAG